jgi:putative transposase
VHAVLDRHDLVKRRRRRIRPRLTGTTLSQPMAPNRLWCADYKGEFLLANHRYCYPLTGTDFASRYLVAREALSTTKKRYAFGVFERAFQECGLPDGIRPGNGVPFASAHGCMGSVSSRCGGSVSGFSWSASRQGIPSRTAATSART